MRATLHRCCFLFWRWRAEVLSVWQSEGCVVRFYSNAPVLLVNQHLLLSPGRPTVTHDRCHLWTMSKCHLHTCMRAHTHRHTITWSRCNLISPVEVCCRQLSKRDHLTLTEVQQHNTLRIFCWITRWKKKIINKNLHVQKKCKGSLFFFFLSFIFASDFQSKTVRMLKWCNSNFCKLFEFY